MPDIVNFTCETCDDGYGGLRHANDRWCGDELHLDEVFKDEGCITDYDVCVLSFVSGEKTRRNVGILAVTCFDHSYKSSEALLCGFRNKADATGDATDGIGDNGIIWIICIVLEFGKSRKARKEVEGMTHDEFPKNGGVGVSGYDIEKKLDLVLFRLWEIVGSDEKPGVERCEEALQRISEWG